MSTTFSLLMGAANGVRHLHQELGMVHLDLKPENILVFRHPDLHAKVADFGHCRGESQRHVRRNVKFDKMLGRSLCELAVRTSWRNSAFDALHGSIIDRWCEASVLRLKVKLYSFKSGTGLTLWMEQEKRATVQQRAQQES